MDRAPRWIASRVEEAPSDAPVAVYLTGGACGSTDTANPDLPKCVTDDAGNKATATQGVTVGTSSPGGLAAAFTFSPTSPVQDSSAR